MLLVGMEYIIRDSLVSYPKNEIPLVSEYKLYH